MSSFIALPRPSMGSTAKDTALHLHDKSDFITHAEDPKDRELYE